MKRQKVRKALLFISFLLFPITIYYLSPYIIIQAGLQGIISGSFIIFSAMLLTSLFFGRAFCGFICPAGGMMDCCTLATDKRAKGGKRNWIKYFIWTPWIITITLLFIKVKRPITLDFIYFTQHGISIARPEAYIIYYFIIALFVTMSFIAGKRASCHYICWMAPFMIIGSKIKNKLKYPSLHLTAESEKCVDCKLCTKKCSMSLDVNQMVKANKMNHSECILCGECVDNCSKSAIKYRFKYDKLK